MKNLSKFYVKKKNLHIVLLFLCALQGCTILHTQIDNPLQFSQDDFNKHQTHISTVLERLGPPAKMSALGNGMAFLYEYTLITERQIAVTIRYGALSLLKFSYAKAGADRQTLLLVFDDKGVLTSYALQDLTEKVGSGVGASFVYSVKSLVDTSHLEEEPAVFHWGTSLFRSLPEALNAHHSLESGQHGLERTGTTKNVGQHSLEMRSTGQ
jgi:hypothetical protein